MTYSDLSNLSRGYLRNHTAVGNSALTTNYEEMASLVTQKQALGDGQERALQKVSERPPLPLQNRAG